MGCLQARLDRAFADRYDQMTAPAEAAWLGEERDRLLSHVRGDVLEIGPGTGSNRGHWPAGLASLTLAEPSAAMRRHLARRYEGFAPGPTILPVGAENLHDVPDASVDAVVSTLVLCSVAHPDAAVREIARVLRPGGVLVLLEHVRGRGVRARLQDAVTPLTRRVAANCHQNRDVIGLLRAHGFDTTDVHDTGRAIGMVVRPVVGGVARLGD